jgi:hypothetical protein
METNKMYIIFSDGFLSERLELEVVHLMSDQIICPECGNKLRRGSTFCMNCGNKIPADILSEQASDKESILDEEKDVLPSLEESGLDEITESGSIVEPTLPEVKTPASTEALSWDEETPSTLAYDETVENKKESSTDRAIKSEIPESTKTSDLSWEEGVDEIKEGMPFKEIEPPRVYAEAHEVHVSTEEALDHLFPEVRDDATRDAVAHLFPEGRGTTSADFIDVIVGKPEKISVKKPLQELDTPVCLSCGTIPTSDGFEYPSYVFDALGKARIENGDKLLQENEHEKAI